ncbi:hypothetical protein CC_2621 [Caulobacter vibrioides CB15]|uniref:Uncharacterized protein n=1 Tax=Caulobacter vibrioides (strain ATCC 19089 / CIP 103742 / CB 15) TaxID=190650 RepID=Q9A544_CAUVC|nr:hypothetical protein CC_2621 [Caulobacter vibrioides CB15]ATC30691.1 hypothetical protein CA607_14165 [Caulobacter vibrioides]
MRKSSSIDRSSGRPARRGYPASSEREASRALLAVLARQFQPFAARSVFFLGSGTNWAASAAAISGPLSNKTIIYCLCFGRPPPPILALRLPEPPGRARRWTGRPERPSIARRDNQGTAHERTDDTHPRSSVRETGGGRRGPGVAP